MTRHIFLRVTLPFAAGSFVNQASRIVVATVGPSIALEFGLSASGLGALAAVFFVAYAAAQLPVGLAIDLHGARRVQATLCLVAALGFGLCALATDAVFLALGRFVTGIGIAGALIGLMKANMQWYPPHRLAAMTGAGIFCGAAGGLAATLPLQALLPLLGWRGAFLVLAAIALLVALWLLLGVPEAPPGGGRGARRPIGREIAEFGRIARHPVFIRTMPAVALLSALVFTYQGLWAGPWLRDVGGLADGPRAGVLFCYALGIMAGQLGGGQIASGLQARGHDPMRLCYAGIAAMLALQFILMARPQGLIPLCLLWFAFACIGSTGPISYSVLAQRFPPELTGRVATVLNFSMLCLVFLLQNAIGAILDLWPRSAAGGWDPAGYGWALGLTVSLQGLTVAWLVAGGRRRLRPADG